MNATEADFAKFKVIVTHANGTTPVQTLAQLGITEINPAADSTRIALPDGSMTTGVAECGRGNGTTGTVADTTLKSEADGHRVVQTTTGDGADNKTTVITAYDAARAVVDGDVNDTANLTRWFPFRPRQPGFRGNRDGGADAVRQLRPRNWPAEVENAMPGCA